ncbi:uroporphyrinogen decarboxylase [Candidatus Sumerlaeota bacterium]|nr:uroporphyrinogen decarboxylase [Candidatus Sumerlaeota bacterium]
MSPLETTTTLSRRERFLRAVRGKAVDRPPVWMMRQAGRYLPEYHTVRARHDFLTMCRTPEAAAEVSIQPLEILGVDAVIVFNDILIPLEAMGLPVTFTERGPELPQPISGATGLDRFHVAEFDSDEPVAQTLRLIRGRIGPEVALLGFAGAPLTMACYAVEGKMTRNLEVVKALRHREPRTLQAALERITETVIHYLRLQIEAGADLVQIFDTWAGSFSVADCREFALPYQRRVIEAIRPLGVPISLYVKGSAPMLELMAESGADVLSVDWTLPLGEVRRRVGSDLTLQGNLDSTTLLSTPEAVRRETRAMLEELGGERHIANLGHGILPSTPVECAQAFVDTVKGWRP